MSERIRGSYDDALYKSTYTWDKADVKSCEVDRQQRQNLGEKLCNFVSLLSSILANSQNTFRVADRRLITWRIVYHLSASLSVSLIHMHLYSLFFLCPSLLPLLINHSVHLYLSLSFTPGLKVKTYLFHKSYPLPHVVSVLPRGLHSRTFARTVSSKILGFVLFFFFIFSFLCRALG